jgi:hypothetical protein
VLRLGLPTVLGAAYYFLIRPQIVQAGTHPGEAERALPGDDIIATPNLQVTRAIDIAAPPEFVWPWIAQMGREHSGYYSLDAVNNQSLPSVAYLRQDLPAPQVGMTMDEGFRILDVESNHLLLYGAFDLPTPWGSTMERTISMLLEPHDGGTRLLVRVRGYTYGMLGPLYNLLYELFDYVQGIIQLENIRQRAETYAELRAPA